VLRRPPPDAALLDRLRTADLEVLGRMPWASNGTFLVGLAGGRGRTPDDHSPHDHSPHDDSPHDDSPGVEGSTADVDREGTAEVDQPPLQAIYKPLRGERPLWDFPSGLYKREVAAYELAAALGWWVVPPTVVRDGPLGEGSVQLFVEADFEQHYFTVQEEARYRDDFEAICVFDLLANNTDRKSGHCLIGTDGRIWAIDHGLCFAEEFKLRTVLWDFAGEPIPAELLEDVRRLLDQDLTPALACLLDDDEHLALLERAEAVLGSGCFPVDRSGRRYPWPLV
jgi:hypothetical protein